MNEADAQVDARCLGCGYLLRGLLDRRCPECGRPFDPDDPHSMYVGLPVGKVGAALLKPIGSRGHAIAYAAAIALVWGEAWLPGGFIVTYVGVGLALVYFAYRAVRATLRAGVARARRRPYEIAQDRRRPGYVLGLAVLLSLLALPHHVTLFLHRPLLERFARHIYAEIPQFEAEKQNHQRIVGLLYIHKTRVRPTGADILVGPNGQISFYEDSEGLKMITFSHGLYWRNMFDPPWWW